jgi:hypothetical protein
MYFKRVSYFMLSNCVCYEAFLSFSQFFPALIYPSDGHYIAILWLCFGYLCVMNLMIHPKLWVYFMHLLSSVCI